MTNEKALLAVQAARVALTSGTYEAGYAVRDLLADLLHYCDEYELDFDNELRLARNNHKAELEE